MISPFWRLAALCVLMVSLAAGCSGAPNPPDDAAAPSVEATRKPALAINLRGLGADESTTLKIIRDASAPQTPDEIVQAFLGETEIEFVSAEDDADLRLGGEGTTPVYEQIVTPADRFSSVLSGIGLDELKGVWAATATTPNFETIYPDESLMQGLEQLLGPASANVKPKPLDELTTTIWNDPMGLVLLPFQELTPRLLALRLDGMSVVDNRLVQSEWPLAVRSYLTPLTPEGEKALAAAGERPPLSNRDPNKLTVLVMTGVTAMARGTAAAIERSGDNAFPARLIGPELAAADLTIISNEIPFDKDCVVNNTLNNLLLCSKPEYYAALELTGVDAVGLSGNHQNDFGYTNMLESLEFYKEKGVPTYAGGANDKDAFAPIFLEHNGNKLVFLGANQYGPGSYTSGTGEVVSAWAGPENPGQRAIQPSADERGHSRTAPSGRSGAGGSAAHRVQFRRRLYGRADPPARIRFPIYEGCRRRHCHRSAGARAAGGGVARRWHHPVWVGQSLLRSDVELADPHGSHPPARDL